MLVVLLAALASLVVGSLRARSQLAAASTSVASMRSALLSGDTEQALIDVAAAQDQTGRARDLTHGPAWAVFGTIPYLGRTPTLISTSTDVADVVAHDVLPDLVTQAAALELNGTVPSNALAVDVNALREAAGPLASADATLQAQSQRLDALKTAGVPQRFTGPFDRLSTDVASLAGLTKGFADVARVAPSMLGATTTKRYLLAVQTPSEARGTGGLLGAYAVLEATQGRISVVATGPRSNLDPSNQAAPRIDLGADYSRLWGDDPGWWVNANVSPHYPYAAAIWADLAKRAGLGRMDGVITVDPIALAALMKPSGPVTVNGRTITSDTLVPLVTKEIYALIPNDDAKRDAYLQQVAGAVLASVLSGRVDSRQWIDAVGRMGAERRILLWTKDKAAQSVIAGSAFGGQVPQGDAANPSPYAFVAVNNIAGTKLDAYLKRTVTYTGGTCSTDSRQTTVTITLTNDAPAGLPPYVVTRSDAASRSAAKPIADGSNRLLVSTYLTAGAGVLSATLDGKPLALQAGRERGHPVVAFPLELPRGGTRAAVLTIREPRSGSPARLDVQPLVRDQTSAVDFAACS